MCSNDNRCCIHPRNWKRCQSPEPDRATEKAIRVGGWHWAQSCHGFGAAKTALFELFTVSFKQTPKKKQALLVSHTEGTSFGLAAYFIAGCRCCPLLVHLKGEIGGITEVENIISFLHPWIGFRVKSFRPMTFGFWLSRFWKVSPC